MTKTNRQRYEHTVHRQKRAEKRGTRRKLKPEIEYEGVSVYISILRMSIKLKEGHTIENWIQTYCERNPNLREKLYKAYNIPTT
jgi:hypothetical protein